MCRYLWFCNYTWNDIDKICALVVGLTRPMIATDRGPACLEPEEKGPTTNADFLLYHVRYWDSLYFSEKKFNFLVCGWRVTIWESMSRTLSRIHKGNRNVRMYGRRAKDSDPRLSDSRLGGSVTKQPMFHSCLAYHTFQKSNSRTTLTQWKRTKSRNLSEPGIVKRCRSI